MMNAAETLLAEGCDDAVALECGPRRVSYARLRDLVARAGAAWRARGLQQGDRVFVVAPDSVDWVVAYLGTMWAGGVAVGVNPRLPAAELAAVLADSQPRFIWCEAELAAPVAKLPGAAPVVVAGCAWDAEVAAAPPLAPTRLDAEAPALWIGTSGTTGVPKGVVHAQRTALHPHAFASGRLGLARHDRLYATSKLFFAYALGNSLFAGLRSGATVILDGEWPTPERVEQIVGQHRPTLLFCVPTLYLKMLQAGVAQRLGGRGIRHFVSAGESLPPATRCAWRAATGHAPVSGYGTTETLCLMLYSDDDTGLLQPTPLTQLASDERVGPHVPQRIRLRNPTVALGYWRRPDAQADAFHDGWFSPGDQFLRHEDGRLEFAGRNDDLLKIAGQWVSTLWVEQALLAAGGDALLQLAVTGVTGREGLGALAALAVAAPGRHAEAAARLHAGIEAMPRLRRPRWVHWLDALPLTATGKLQRSRLRDLHEQATAAAVAG